MTYGSQLTTKYDAYCGRCGKYLSPEEHHTGPRGEQQCDFCNNQVRTKPIPCRRDNKSEAP